MSWISEPKLSWPEWFFMKIIQVGPIPKHLAVIMDGNRRFAKQMQQETLDGHREGFKKLTEVLYWCRNIGINEVTAYAFSIENFKRPKQEVDGLMDLAEEKFKLLIKEIDQLNKHGVKIRVIGNLSLLKPSLQRTAAIAMDATKQNNSCCLNLAVAYTSRDEIKTGMDEIQDGVNKGLIVPEDIDKNLLGKCLYTNDITTDPDLLIRTSGEIRLSDFLLWQSSYTYLFFAKVLWPEITFKHLLMAVFHYQRHQHILKQTIKDISDDCQPQDTAKSVRIHKFLDNLAEKRAQTINSYLEIVTS